MPWVCNLGTQDYEIEDVIMHPSYDPYKLYQHDIALIRLKQKVSKNSKYTNYKQIKITFN